MSVVRAEPVEARLFDRLRANGFVNKSCRINRQTKRPGKSRPCVFIDPARFIHEIVGCAMRTDRQNGAHGAPYG